MWHAIQHCVNAARGTNFLTPVENDITQLNEYVAAGLDQETIDFVKSNYKSSQWAMELEANLAEAWFTPIELMELFIDSCTAQ